MKAGLLIISIFVIFTIVCSPVLAISKQELVARYKSEMVPITNPMVININYTTPLPTPTPTPYVPSGFTKPSLNWPYPDFLKPFSKPSIPSSPIVKPSLIPEMKSCPPAVPSRPLYHVMVYCSCSPEATCDCVDPETGEHYPIGSDMEGNQYIVKPGCQCTWG
jgi:hypothetical protein